MTLTKFSFTAAPITFKQLTKNNKSVLFTMVEFFFIGLLASSWQKTVSSDQTRFDLPKRTQPMDTNDSTQQVMISPPVCII